MVDQGVPSDIELVKLARAGSASAFGELYQRYVDQIFRFVFANVNHRLDAEDLTSEVFLRAWRSLPRYQEQGFPFSSYLYRIARNLVVDRFRKKNLTDVPVDEELPDIPRSIGAAEVSAANQERLNLHQQMALLREDYRMVLILRFLNGLSTRDTARVMGRSSGAIRVLQYRALNALREQMPKPNKNGADEKENNNA